MGHPSQTTTSDAEKKPMTHFFEVEALLNDSNKVFTSKNIKNELLLVELLQFLHECGDTVCFALPDKKDKKYDYEPRQNVQVFYNTNPQIRDFFNAVTLIPQRELDEKTKDLLEDTFTLTTTQSIAQSERVKTFKNSPDYLLKVLEKAYDHLEPENQEKMKELYNQLKIKILLVNEYEMTSPTKEAFQKIQPKEKIQPNGRPSTPLEMAKKQQFERTKQFATDPNYSTATDPDATATPDFIKNFKEHRQQVANNLDLIKERSITDVAQKSGDLSDTDEEEANFQRFLGFAAFQSKNPTQKVETPETSTRSREPTPPQTPSPATSAENSTASAAAVTIAPTSTPRTSTSPTHAFEKTIDGATVEPTPPRTPSPVTAVGNSKTDPATSASQHTPPANTSSPRSVDKTIDKAKIEKIILKIDKKRKRFESVVRFFSLFKKNRRRQKKTLTKRFLGFLRKEESALTETALKDYLKRFSDAQKYFEEKSKITDDDIEKMIGYISIGTGAPQTKKQLTFFEKRGHAKEDRRLKNIQGFVEKELAEPKTEEPKKKLKRKGK